MGTASLFRVKGAETWGGSPIPIERRGWGKSRAIHLLLLIPPGPSWSVRGWASYLRFYLFNQATFKNLEAHGVHTQYYCDLTASFKALERYEWISGKVICRSCAYEFKFSVVSFRNSKVLILINKWNKRFISPTFSWSLSKQKKKN